MMYGVTPKVGTASLKRARDIGISWTSILRMSVVGKVDDGIGVFIFRQRTTATSSDNTHTPVSVLPTAGDRRK